MEHETVTAARDELGNLIQVGDTVRFRVVARMQFSRDIVQMREGRVIEIYLDNALPRLTIDTGEFRYTRPSMLCRKVWNVSAK